MKEKLWKLQKVCHTIHWLLFEVKEFHDFYRLLRKHKRVLVNFFMWILWKLVKVGNYEHVFGNKGKGTKHQKFFTTNNKQYTSTIFIWIEAWAFISYKWFLTQHLYKSTFYIIHRRLFTLEHWIPAFIWAQRRLYEPCFYLDKYSIQCG